jgi:hypothetical protein
LCSSSSSSSIIVFKTLCKEEFGFLGVTVDKLTNKSPLLPLYRTVHEIFSSYGSSFNSFEAVGVKQLDHKEMTIIAFEGTYRTKGPLESHAFD